MIMLKKWALLTLLISILVSCNSDDPAAEDTSGGGADLVDIPEVVFTCNKSSVTACDTGIDNHYAWVLLRKANTETIVAQALERVSCDADKCTVTIDSWVDKNGSNITQIENSVYDKLGAMDVDDDVTSLSDVSSNGMESGVDVRCAEDDQTIGSGTSSVGLETCKMVP